MLGILVLLFVSGLCCWWFDRSGLHRALGLLPGRRVILLAVLLFLGTGLCASLMYLFRMYFGGERYVLSANVQAPTLLTGFYVQLRSVLTEELLCRGALLYMIYRKWGMRWAIVSTAIVFGAFHWFNSGVWGNLVSMAIIFCYTFAMGLVLAYGVLKTKSIWTAVAIHAGWNMAQNFVFPGGPFPQHIFVLAAPSPVVTVSYGVFFLISVFPQLAAMGWNYWVLRRVNVNAYSSVS